MKHAFLGVLAIALGLWGMHAWWANFGMVMRGLIPFFLVAIGVIAVLSSYYRLADEYAPEEEED